MTREELSALLALAGPDELVRVADACLADGVDFEILTPPRVGVVATQVREPIMGERFLLGDVLACQAEVRLGGTRGWAMRLGDNTTAVVAAAVCDAEYAANGPQAALVRQLGADVADRQAAREAAEWAQLAPTIVEFEELK